VGCTVLIVDDHAGFRSFARAVLEAAGFEVVGEAGDGESALVATRRREPDVVLLDVALPDADGCSVCEGMFAGGGGLVVVMTSSRDISSCRSPLEQRWRGCSADSPMVSTRRCERCRGTKCAATRRCGALASGATRRDDRVRC
jgi:DNA-binding NarL/FixJ family response regulator